MSMLLVIVYPGIEYCKDRVFLFDDVIGTDWVNMVMREIYGVDVKQEIHALGAFDGHKDSEVVDVDDDEFDHFVGGTQ